MAQEWIWDSYLVWPDLLGHLKSRLQQNDVFNDIQVLQIQWKGSENHYVQQTWKTGS